FRHAQIETSRPFPAPMGDFQQPRTMADLPPLPPPVEGRRRWLVPLIVAVVVAILVAIGWRYWGPSSDGDAQKGQTADGKGGKGGAGKAGAGKGGRFAGGASGVQPVAAATAKMGDINIVQTALGTATALRSVTVKPRVDGLL